MKTTIKLCSIVFTLMCSINAWTQRHTETINNSWKFHKGDIENVIQKNIDDSKWETVNIPHTWNALDVLDDKPGYYRGVSWYRKELNITSVNKGKMLYIYFEGANQDAEIYINGKKIGEHFGGYASFLFDITKFIDYDSKNILSVRLNNALNPDLPPLGGDLCHFGGIYRDVYLVYTEPIHFDMDNFASSGVFIKLPKISEKSATVSISGKVRNDSEKTLNLSIVNDIISPNSDVIQNLTVKIEVKANSSKEFDVIGKSISNPLLWSPETPNLYHVHSRIMDAEGNIIDEVSNPLGMRWISVDADKGFFLNGERCQIKGVGKHQDYDKIGYAVPNKIMENDIQMLKDMGGNLVRGHYQFDPVVYSKCDELGIMTIPRLPVLDKIGQSKEFEESCKRMMMEMMTQNYNHPSVIIWEYFNEVFGDMDWYWEKPQNPEKVKENMDITYKLSVEMEKLVREFDPSRLTEYVFHTDPTPEWYHEAGLDNICYINGWNLYQGWYHRSLDSVGAAIDEFRKYNPNVGYIISEFGAGSDPRIHTYKPTIYDCSIEYQDMFHKKYFEETAKREWIAGTCMWTFLDFQVDGRHDAVPHINSKGILRSDRTTKDGYYLYQAHWSEKPMVHIASKDWVSRKEIVKGDVANREITVYSNQKEVELFLNGKTLGQKSIVNKEAIWNVPFVNGKNQIEAIINVDDKIINDFLEINFEFVSGNIKKDGLPVDGLNINVGQSRTYLIEDNTGIIWMPDMEYKEGNWGHKNGNYYRVWNNMSACQGIREGVGQDMYGTGIDPVFQTFLVGITDYKFDVPDGKYEVTLCFSEPFSKNTRLKPEEQTGSDSNGDRVFTVKVNNVTVFQNLDMDKQYGTYVAVTKTVTVNANGNGILIKLMPVKGQAIINGIKIGEL